MFQIFEAENVFYSRFSVDQEEDVVDSTDCSAVSIPYVVVEYVSDLFRSRDGS